MPTFYYELLPSGGLRQVIDWTPRETASMIRDVTLQAAQQTPVFGFQQPAGATNGIAPVAPYPETNLEAVSGPKLALAPDTRYYPCVGSPEVPSCTHMGTMHTPRCAVCGCPQHHPWTPPGVEAEGVEDRHHG